MYWYLPTYFSGVTMILRRHDLDLLTGGFYLPTGIFAILSMISYFIHPEVVPGRMGLLVTLFLISSNVYNSLKGPQNRGFSYIDFCVHFSELGPRTGAVTLFGGFP